MIHCSVTHPSPLPPLDKNLARLPNEILEQIFSSLKWRGRFDCLTVCRSWHSAAMTALYRSVPLSALVSTSPSFACFHKYSHLVKEIEWTHMNPMDERLESVKQFLLQPHPQNPREDALQSGNQNPETQKGSGLCLSSFLYIGTSMQPDMESFMMKLFDCQPKLTRVQMSASQNTPVALSLEKILKCLPLLTYLHIDGYRSETLNPSLWVLDPLTLSDGYSDKAGVVRAKSPQYALKTLRFHRALDMNPDDFEYLFSALPELVSLEVSSGRMEISHHFWPELATAGEVSGTKLAEALIQHCPKLQRIEVVSPYLAARLDPHWYLPGAEYNRDGKTPLTTILPKLLKMRFEHSFRNSRESLNWVLEACGRGLTFLDISQRQPSSQPVVAGHFAPPAVVDAIPSASDTSVAEPKRNTEIRSLDLQRILENSPNLTSFVARGRLLNLKDMAPLSALDLSTGKSAIASTGNELRPWACSRTLERLVIGVTAGTDDPKEHQRAWAQLGQLQRIIHFELSETDLIPRLSHGLGRMGPRITMASFTIDRWIGQRSLDVSVQELEGEADTRTKMLMDGETVAWIAQHWSGLGNLRLDIGVSELQEEMRALVSQEKVAGRMKRVTLSMTRMPSRVA